MLVFGLSIMPSTHDLNFYHRQKIRVKIGACAPNDTRIENCKLDFVCLASSKELNKNLEIPHMTERNNDS